MIQVIEGTNNSRDNGEKLGELEEEGCQSLLECIWGDEWAGEGDFAGGG